VAEMGESIYLFRHIFYHIVGGRTTQNIILGIAQDEYWVYNAIGEEYIP